MGLGWLEGRATEERPPWGYADLMGSRLATVASALDIDTGGGELIATVPILPPRMSVTESWPPNAQRARELLTPRGVEVTETRDAEPLPFPDGSFDLVTSRHPIQPDWPDIHRVLNPGGHYFAQHVGPASAFELIELFLGPLLMQRSRRGPHEEVQAARAAGLTIVDLRTARCRMEFDDVGAVVWILRKCVWWVPDFSVAGYLDQLRQLDRQLRSGEPFVAYSTRHLIEARR